MEKFGINLNAFDLNALNLDVLKESLADITWKLFGVDITSGPEFLEIQCEVVSNETGLSLTKVLMFFYELRNAHIYSSTVYQFLDSLDLALSIIAEDLEKLKIRK
jgi:hypothetical protein